MVSKLAVFVVALALISQAVLAGTSQVNIMTVRDAKVWIGVLDPSQVYSLVTSVILTSNENGYAKGSFSAELNDVNLFVKVTSGNEVIVSEKFEGYEPGEDIYMRFFTNEENPRAEPFDEQGNLLSQTEDVPANITSEVNSSEIVIDEGSLLTGQVISDDNFFSGLFSSNTFYYIIGGVLIAFIAVFVVLGVIRKRIPTNRSIRTIKMNDFLKDAAKDNAANASEQVAILKEQLQEAQKEIFNAKKAQKVREAEFRLQEAQKELERIKNDSSLY